MIARLDYTTSSLAADANSLNGLHAAAKEGSPEATKQAAKQFEGLFLNMMLKSMRDATPQDGPMDNEQSKMFTSMLDQQMSQKMADKGMGLADALVRQLTPANKKDAGVTQGDTTIPTSKTSAASAPGHAMKSGAGKITQSSNVKAFQDKLAEHAEQASKVTGIPAKFMLGQAALESGWGKHEIRAADGSSSHNLFGIKATAGWKGKVVETATTEYVNGVPQTKMQKFRVYDSYADAFTDYAKMLSNNPRYGAVIANSHDATSFAQGLQKAGYATDPHYATKLSNIINNSLV
jgi:flagellar protein FlgJ